MNDENIVRGVGGESNEIENHRHCQATVLSAYGPTGDGKTKDEIDDLVLGNLRQDWKDNFLNNRNNITEDLAGILKVINSNFGDVLKRLAFGESSIDKLNLGKPIVLTLTTSDGDKTFKFNTIKPNDGSEVYQVDIPGSDVKSGTGLTKTGNIISLQKASPNDLGGVKVGSGLSVDENGTLSAIQNEVPIMSSTTAGIAKVGSGLKVQNQILSLDYSESVSGKMDKVKEGVGDFTQTATPGNVAIFGTNGQVVDSERRIAPDAKEDALESDIVTVGYLSKTPCLLTGEVLRTTKLDPSKSISSKILDVSQKINDKQVAIYIVQEDSYVSIQPADLLNHAEGYGFEVKIINPNYTDISKNTYMGNSYEWIGGQDLITNFCFGCKKGTRILFVYKQLTFTKIASPTTESPTNFLAKADSINVDYTDTTWSAIVTEMKLIA